MYEIEQNGVRLLEKYADSMYMTQQQIQSQSFTTERLEESV